MIILRRYLLRETLSVWMVVTLVLLGILLSNQFARVLGDAAANRLPRDAVLQAMGLTSMQYLTILVPVAFLLGVMLALARLYRDSEMAAMMACGVGSGAVYRALTPLVALMAAGLAWLSLEGAPWAMRELQAIELEMRRDAALGVVEPGRFITIGDADAVLYAEQVSADGVLRNLFIQRQVGERTEVVLADRGERRTGADGQTQSFVLFNGRRYEGIPGRRDFRVVEFAEHGIPLPPVPDSALRTSIEGIAFSALLGDSDPGALAELHWRLSGPVSLFALLLLAVPLARTDPRRGRFGKVGIGILIYLVYTNLLTAGRLWLERGVLPEWLGLWWVHALVLALGVVLLLREQGRLRRAPAPPRDDALAGAAT